MAFSRICQGVTKSGSPTPREITSFIPSTKSKNARMPDGCIFCTFLETIFFMVLRFYSSNVLRLFGCSFNLRTCEQKNLRTSNRKLLSFYFLPYVLKLPRLLCIFSAENALPCLLHSQGMRVFLQQNLLLYEYFFLQP